LIDPEGDWGLTTIRIDRVLNDSTGEIFFYALSTFNWTSGEWNTMCEKNGNATEAIFLNGYWDPLNQSRIDAPPSVTIACRHYALAKCVEWGYKPWDNATSCNSMGQCESVSLRDYHQTCTRMCRADYCGDGQGWTADGTLIDIWDNLTPPIQARAAPEWPVEAEWNMDGAACVSGTRLTHWMKEGQPQCANKPNLWKQQPQCGTMVGSRSMLGTSFPPPPQTSNQDTKSQSSSADLIPILVPSVVVPVVVLIAGLICFYFWKRGSKQTTPLKSTDPPTPSSASSEVGSSSDTCATNV